MAMFVKVCLPDTCGVEFRSESVADFDKLLTRASLACPRNEPFLFFAGYFSAFGASITRISGTTILFAPALTALDNGPSLRISRSFRISDTPSLFVVWTISRGSSFGERILIPKCNALTNF